MGTTASILRRLRAPGAWPFTVAGVSLLLASIFIFFRLGRAQQIAGMVAFVFLGLGIAFGIIGKISPSRARLIWRLLILLALGLIVVESIFLSRRGAPPPPAEPVSKVSNEDFMQFAGTLALAKRYAADTNVPPLLQATLDEPVNKEISFTAPKAGDYRLAVQMADTPFVTYAQHESDYLSLVGVGRTVGQTFRVTDRITQLTGIRIKLESRSLPNNMPATSVPDKPLIVSFRPLIAEGEPTNTAEIELPPTEAGLNDAWRWATLPFEVDLSQGGNRSFIVEFTSESEIIGWALAHVTSSFQGKNDFYADGELLVNREVYKPGGDLVFEILGRNEQSSVPEVLVDKTLLSLKVVDEDAQWFLSQPISLREGAEHKLVVRSSNPHISFYGFVFVQEQAPVEKGEDETEKVR